MNNADMPAMPQEWEAYVEGGAPSGLTKREYFAGLAMQALVSDIVNAEANGYEVTSDQTAKEAVSQADALLAELEKEKEQ